MKFYSLFLMSEDQFKAFLEKVSSDSSIQDKLKAANDANAIAAIANEAGFSISAENLVSSSDLDLSNEDLSDNDLEEVAGGAWDARKKNAAYMTVGMTAIGGAGAVWYYSNKK